VKAFHEDVGLPDQPHQTLAAAVGAQVERQAALVAVHRGTQAPPKCGGNARRERFDLDHIGAHVAQDLAGRRAAHDA
jgi:hypothetical protein